MEIESNGYEFSRYKRIQLNHWRNKVRTIWTIDLEKSFGYLQLNKLKCRIVVQFLDQLFCGISSIEIRFIVLFRWFAKIQKIKHHSFSNMESAWVMKSLINLKQVQLRNTVFNEK